MDGGDDDDGDANEQFERKGIDDVNLMGLWSWDFGLCTWSFALFTREIQASINYRYKNKEQRPKNKDPSLSTFLDFVSCAYPGTCSTGDVEQICEAVLFENARGRARAIAAGADHSS